MPNYCQVELYFNQEGALDAITKFMGDKVMDFNKLIPYPEHFDRRDQMCRDAKTPEQQKAYIEQYGTSKDGYNVGGYEWCIENWGTKWNAGSVRVEGDHIVFDTPWGPPEPVLIELSKRFPQYTFYVEFFERGGAYCGGFSFLCEDDWWDPDDREWQPGTKIREWKGEYNGHKGG